MSNITDAVSDSLNGKCANFGDKIYFTVVKIFHQVIVQEYKESAIHFD